MNKSLAVLALVVLGLCVMSLRPPLTVRAQSGSLPLGTVALNGSDPIPCSEALNGSQFLPGMSCLSGTISSCSNAQPIGITYGWSSPSGPISGTIVLFSGGPGTAPAEYADDNQAYAAAYQSKYVVVQVEFNSPWEDPNNGAGGSILDAACRPATFLSFVNATVGLHPTGKAMCAQGSSAGSGAIGYALAWYGASSYLTNVEMLSGPVFGEIDQGCTYPNALDMTICAAGQYGCTPKTTTWMDDVIYVGHYAGSVSNWSGLPSCGTAQVNSNNYPTWAQMSIVDGTSTVTPTFSYPSTSTHGWLCSSYSVCDDGTCPNNSGAQGNYFYEALNPANGNLKLTGVTLCNQEEGIGGGYDPDTKLKASQAITNDMNAQCQPSQ